MGGEGNIDDDIKRWWMRYFENLKQLDHDGMNVWKVLKGNGYRWLTLFFNKLLQEEFIPDQWCASSLVPTYKIKGDTGLQQLTGNKSHVT